MAGGPWQPAAAPSFPFSGFGFCSFCLAQSNMLHCSHHCSHTSSGCSWWTREEEEGPREEEEGPREQKLEQLGKHFFRCASISRRALEEITLQGVVDRMSRFSSRSGMTNWKNKLIQSLLKESPWVAGSAADAVGGETGAAGNQIMIMIEGKTLVGGCRSCRCDA